MAPSPTYQITEAHEDRIQRLESSMEKVAASTAATSVKMDQLVITVERGFSAVNARLDDGNERLDDGNKKFHNQEHEIDALKALEASRGKRWAAVKGASLPLVFGAAGVIATKFGESIWTWLSHLF